MIETKPLNTSTGLGPDAPGPEQSKHWAILESHLMRFNLESAAQQIHQLNLQEAENYRQYHLELVQEGPDVEVERRFVNRNADKQVADAEARLQANLATIDEKCKAAPEQYQFFTAGHAICGHPEAWCFDAPAGFGDLSWEEETKIALAQRPSKEGQ